jgi:Winged helix DNA-binding domain
VSRPIGDPSEILRRRLANQHLVGQRVREPREMVARLGAVQSQDYPGALWALALRVKGASIQSLQCAFDRGEILRTHVLRPTWHLVAPEDVRWMLALTGPRIRRSMTSRERDLGMDPKLISRSNDAIARALEGGKALTRSELGVALTEVGIDWHNDGGLLAHLASTAELAAVICSGPLKGTQHTYALLDERAPPARSVSRDEAVAELVCRYFTSHGPATLNDFAWWSGLTVGDAREGLGALRTRFTSQKLGELTFWYDPDAVVGRAEGPAMLLLPNFDEFTVAYRSRELFYPREIVYRPGPRYDAPFGNMIVVDGTVVGIWKRTVRKGQLAIEPEWFNPPSPKEAAAFDETVGRYAAFMGLPLQRWC